MLSSFYISHGGGPLPILGSQPDVVLYLRAIINKYLIKIPKAIVIITPHWKTNEITVSSNIKHLLYYDYSGFPEESYRLQYNAKGSPEVAHKIIEILNQNSIPCRGDNTRGWDHGVFIPLLIMFPKQDIPIVAMSINRNLDPAYHIKVGQVISTLKDSDDVLFIGSGSSFHNFKYFFASDTKILQEGVKASLLWHEFLKDTLTSKDITINERIQKMIQWENAPGGIQAQPVGQEDHLIPLHVLIGINNGDPGYLIELDDQDSNCSNNALSSFKYTYVGW